jgi:hypothetical protein
MATVFGDVRFRGKADISSDRRIRRAGGVDRGRWHRHIEVPDHAADTIFEQFAVINSHAGRIANLPAAVEL